MLLLLTLFGFLGVSVGYREKRYLVYPDGGPARAQFIIGLGIPVDLKEASVTVGTVIKFQYDLPTNSTEYTSRIYGFAETVSRDMDDGGSKDLEDNEINTEQESRKHNSDGTEAVTELNSDAVDDNNDTLVDITFNKKRKRSLQYVEGGIINEDEINTEIPLQDAIRRQELIDKNAVDIEEEPQRMNRFDFYKILEQMVERYGYTGRPCLLRTICEAAEVPFTHENGLLAEIGHILLTPSTTKDALSHHTDNEYHAAERIGRQSGGADCGTLFPECEGSILDTFTKIGETTLHKFGIV